MAGYTGWQDDKNRSPEHKSQQKNYVEVYANNPVAHGVLRLYSRGASLLVAEAVLFLIAGVFVLLLPVGSLTALLVTG